MTSLEVQISTASGETERIDDIPLIVEWLKQIGIAKTIDQSLNEPHGNHQGLSFGQLSVLFLTYIISQGDQPFGLTKGQRLCAVEPWVKTHKKILELSTGWTIGDKDVTVDLGRPKG